MPVELNKIPEKASLPEPPDKLRWLFIIILIIIIGAAASLYFWPTGMTTRSVWFWFCTLALPVFTGIASYALRLHFYENECDRIQWWNHLHQEQYDSHVMLGQRRAFVLGKAYITPIANNKLAPALLGSGGQLQSYFSTFVQRSLTTAMLLPYPQRFTEEEYLSRLDVFLEKLILMVKPDLTQLTDTLSVRIHHDGMLVSAQIRSIWEKHFTGVYPVTELTVETGSDGLMWLDKWLDKQERQVILSVEINLFGELMDMSAESVSALLLASPEWVREYGDEVASTVIQRPVITTSDNRKTDEALLWGKLVAGDKFSLWRAGVKGDALTSRLQAMDASGYILGMQDEHVLDDLFGCPGAAGGNILLICASEYAELTNLPQLLMVKNNTVHQAIVRPVNS